MGIIPHRLEYYIKKMNKYFKHFTLGLLFLLCYDIKGQNLDNVWVLGFNSKIPDTLYSYINMDFNGESVRFIKQRNRKFDISGANSSLCDKKGNLISWTNGQIIIGKDEVVIEDTINYAWDIPYHCREWEYNNHGTSQESRPEGNLGKQNVMILPINDTLHYVFYNSINYCRQEADRLWYSAYMTDTNYTSAKMLYRDSLLLKQRLHPTFTACRHANGKDWWLITFTLGTHDILTFLVTEQGVQQVNAPIPNPFAKDTTSTGQVVVSPGGDKIAWYSGERFTPDGGGWVVADIDRCTGEVWNMTGKTVSQEEYIGTAVAFSPSGRFLYVSNGRWLWQYDVTAEDILATEILIAEKDTFTFYLPWWGGSVGVDLCHMKLGPDGRIYIFSCITTNRYIGVINYPDEKGTLADVKQHALYTPVYFARTVPNMPEYRLGPLDGSPCDTLGIDNHPVAKYRYEPDTTDYRHIRFTDLSYFRPEMWSWDFGDGSARSSERHPRHTYALNGTYTVCLTVSNEIDSHTTCRTLTIGPSSTGDAGTGVTAAITLYPNPVEDLLLVTLGEYIPESGVITIYDISGRQVAEHVVRYGHNTLDLSPLAAGTYLWVLRDKGLRLGTGRIVKQ